MYASFYMEKRSGGYPGVRCRDCEKNVERGTWRVKNATHMIWWETYKEEWGWQKFRIYKVLRSMWFRRSTPPVVLCDEHADLFMKNLRSEVEK